ncbi:hypothetical protein V6000_007512 [Aspergillus fumigatus]
MPSRYDSLEHLVLGSIHGFRPANYAVRTDVMDTGTLCEDIMVRLQAQLQRSLPGKAKGQLKGAWQSAHTLPATCFTAAITPMKLTRLKIFMATSLAASHETK